MTAMAKLLLAHFETAETDRIRALLEPAGHRVAIASADDDLASLGLSAADAVVAGTSDTALLAPLTARFPVLAIGSAQSVQEAVAAIRSGAVAYLGDDELDSRLASEVATLCAVEDPPQIHGDNEAIKLLRGQIDRAAGSDVPVVIVGESGTGKERIARRLHLLSPRRREALITYNCAAAIDAILDRDLFGDGGQVGALVAAAGGTLFLDEITALSAQAQARLLATLDNVNNDVRMLVGARRDLADAAAAGDFREDLLLRLNVVALKLPPLRDRLDDIDALSDECLTAAQNRLARKSSGFSEQARQDMRRYQWPGNLRELENAVERAVILSDGGPITTEGLAIRLEQQSPKQASSEGSLSAADAEKGTLEDYFVSFVLEHQDTMTETEIAKSLGISRKSLWERRQRLNIPRKRGKAKKVAKKGSSEDG